PKEIEFAFGAPNDPYGFKPTDIVVDFDGSMYIADWADGQRPRRGRGRIYRISYVGQPGDKPKEQLKGPDWLDANSYYERCRAQHALERRGREALTELADHIKKDHFGYQGRMHAVWITAKIEGPKAVGKLLEIAKSDPASQVKAQAIRAIA